MGTRSTVGWALVVVALAGVGVGMAQVALQNDGIQFPDGSVQATAAAPLGEFVQGTGTVSINEFQFCSSGVLYSVPNGKVLHIQWISIRLAGFSATAGPVEANIRTTLDDTELFYPLVRMDDLILIADSIFYGDRWHSLVSMGAQGGEDVDISGCRDGDLDNPFSIYVNFHGRLYDEAS